MKKNPRSKDGVSVVIEKYMDYPSIEISKNISFEACFSFKVKCGSLIYKKRFLI